MKSPEYTAKSNLKKLAKQGYFIFQVKQQVNTLIERMDYWKDRALTGDVEHSGDRQQIRDLKSQVEKLEFKVQELGGNNGKD